MKIIIEKEDVDLSPTSIKSLLLKLKNLIKYKNENLDIYLNFKKEDISELSITIIWQLLKKAKLQNVKMNVWYKDTQKEFFDERHFFDSLSGRKSSFLSPSVPVNFETFNPVRPSSSNPQNDSIDKILNDVTKNILEKNNELHKEIKIHMIESISNAFDHSQSDLTNPAGIICSLKQEDILDFCVADMGQGMIKSFLSNPLLIRKYAKLNEWDVVKLATNKDVSCNPVNARNPNYIYSNGGIGLYYLKEFIRYHNDCKIIIISGKGYFHLEKGRKEKIANLKTRWPGTIVYFRVKINQKKSLDYKKLAGDKFLEEFDNK